MIPRADDVRNALRSFPACFRVGFSESVAYRAEYIIWILTSTMPLIMLAIWDSVARSGPISGFGRDEFARYYTVTLVARQLTAAWIAYVLAFEIRTGHLSPQLLRPLHPVLLHAGRNLAAMPLRMLAMLPLLGALLWWRPQMAIPFELWRAGLFLWTAAVGWCVAYLVQAIFGTLAFWFDQSQGLYAIWFAAFALLSGYMMPIALLPEGLAVAARWLPFRAVLGLPVEIATGLIDPAELPLDLALQVGWLIAAWIVFQLTWRRGIARYGAFGA